MDVSLVVASFLSLVSIVSGQFPCPLGFEVQSPHGECKCLTLDSRVSCNQQAQQLSLKIGDCLTYNESLDTVSVVPCPYIHPAAENTTSFYFPLPPNMTASELNSSMCGEMNRTGRLCGQCKNGTGPSVFSPDLKCVRCLDSSYGWAVYLAAEFIPITVFVLLIVLFRIRLCADYMNAFVLFCSLSASVINSYQLSILYMLNARKEALFLLSIYNIFNLQFFQNYLPSFCISEKMTNVEVVALSYLVALYPLLLIFVITTLVSMYDRNFRPVVLAWKPFGVVFSCFSDSFNVRHSLVHAFASFFILSFLRTSVTSVTLILPVVAGVEIGPHINLSESVHYLDGTMYSLTDGFSVIAILIFLLLIGLPTVLIFVYPTRTFQKCLNCCGLRCLPLHIFMDAFQGCYKNGTDGTRDYRYFSGIYFVLRFVVIADVFHCLRLPSYATPVFFLIVSSLLFAICRPYKRDIFNVVDCLMSCIMAFSSFLFFYQLDQRVKFSVSQEAVVLLLLCTPLFYLMILIGCFLFPKCRLRAQLFLLAISHFMNTRNFEDSDIGD